jgi:hypothetical protein
MERRGLVTEAMVTRLENLHQPHNHPLRTGTKFRCVPDCRIGTPRLADDMLNYILDGSGVPAGTIPAEWERAVVETYEQYLLTYARSHPDRALLNGIDWTAFTCAAHRPR